MFCALTDINDASGPKNTRNSLPASAAPRFLALRRRRLAAGVYEALVDDLPGAVDPRQREEVDERNRPPEALLAEGHQCDVIVLLDGFDFCLVAAVASATMW